MWGVCVCMCVWGEVDGPTPYCAARQITVHDMCGGCTQCSYLCGSQMLMLLSFFLQAE